MDVSYDDNIYQEYLTSIEDYSLILLISVNYNVTAVGGQIESDLSNTKNYQVISHRTGLKIMKDL